MVNTDKNQCAMSSRTDHRRARLQEIITAACGGVIRVFAERIGRDPTYISRLLYEAGKAGGRNVGDEIAEATEREFKLVKGWFDLPLGVLVPGATDSNVPHEDTENVGWPPSWPFQRLSKSQWSLLSTAEKEHIEDCALLFLSVHATQELKAHG